VNLSSYRLRDGKGKYLKWIGTPHEQRVRVAKKLFWRMVKAEEAMFMTRQVFRNELHDCIAPLGGGLPQLANLSDAQNSATTGSRWVAFNRMIEYYINLELVKRAAQAPTSGVPS
jgi:hypothetical protein